MSDGTVAWHGGMDTSRGADDISQDQYSKAVNVIVPDSLGGLRPRFGIHCLSTSFDNEETKDLYRHGNVQGQGYYKSGNEHFLVFVVSGYILRATKIRAKSYYIENLNPSSRISE